MLLKRIEVQGFKSFANKTEIEFKDGITAIVGPNGSGKSNIVDAVKWVLGEQSVKSLRGNKMEDVIFSGTIKRRALGYTEVTITFDNTVETIPMEYQEVAITRRIFRSGESEYYINKNACRLRDIRELFMDTGIGIDGYSIIGQGRIDEILSNKPEDRRNIFEEAAGIVKYKTKKMEAERKLEKTEANLVRINDLMHELTKQEKDLKEQSDNATLFYQLSNRIKTIEINLLIKKAEELSQGIEMYRIEKDDLQKKIDETIKNKQNIENRFNAMKETIQELDLSINRVETIRADVQNRISTRNNDLNVLKEKEKFNSKDMKRQIQEIENQKIRLVEFNANKHKLSDKMAGLIKELDLCNKEYAKSNSIMEELNIKIRTKEKEIENKKNNETLLYNTIAEIKGKINSIISFKDNINARIEQIRKEIFLLEEKDCVKLLESVKVKELTKKEQILDYNKHLANLRINEKHDNDMLEGIYKQLDKNKIELQKKISSYNLLKSIKDDYEGYYKGVKNLMQASKKIEALKTRVIGVISELITVEERYEKAIYVALSGSLQNIVTKDEMDGKYIIDYLRNKRLGRITLLPISTIRGKPVHISSKDREEQGILGLASELVNYDLMYDNIFKYLLGRTIVVEDLHKAIEIAKKHNYAYKIVTLKGDIINAGGSMTGGSLSGANEGFLNRDNKLETIKKEINSLSKIQNELEKEKGKLEQVAKENIKMLKDEEEKLYECNIELIRIENEKNMLTGEIERNAELLKKHNCEIDDLNEELKTLVKEEQELKKELDFFVEQDNAIQKDIEKLVLLFKEQKTKKENIMNEIADIKTKVNLNENNLENVKEKISYYNIEIDNIKKDIIAREKKLLSTNGEIRLTVNDMSKIEEEMQDLLKTKQKVVEEFSILKESRDRLLKNYYYEQDRLNKSNEKMNEQIKMMNKWDLKETRHSIQLENVSTKLMESYGLELKDADKFRTNIGDIKKSVEEMEDLKDEIANMGTVNLNAIEEYKKVTNRLEFMNKQHKDLSLAKENLHKVIIDMELRMRELFLKKFNDINDKFKVVFSSLFEGGMANLSLGDEKNVLNCGIDIEAQPPGKKLQNINLLSGGEKALTAIAVLFAILKVKPTPFCILDEIDATLDEANINRYTSYLKNISKNTQFIIITHKKSTMEIADVLYGVTMEEEGISKIVSIQLTDNMEEIAS